MTDRDFLDDPVPIIVSSYLSEDGKRRIMDCPYCEEKFMRDVIGKVSPELIDAIACHAGAI